MADRAAQQRVLAQVDPADLVGLGSALIRMPSFKTEETPVAGFRAPFFRERGYRVELQEIEPGRLQTIATLPGAGGGASLMLNGHTDINVLTRRWKRDPWTPSLEGDWLYGHGVQNMKGGVALWGPAAPDRHAARSCRHPEDRRTPGARSLRAEPRPRPTRARRRALIGSGRAGCRRACAPPRGAISTDPAGPSGG